MKRSRGLLSDAQRMTILVSAAIIVAFEIVTILFMTNAMTDDLIRSSRTVADEIEVILEDPLYNIDDDQARRIAEVLLSSGRISGIVLNSSATGEIVSRPASVPSRYIPPVHRLVEREGLVLGEVYLEFSDAEIRGMRFRFVVLALVIIGAVVLANLVATRFLIIKKISREFVPIRQGIDEISRGNYGKPIELGPYHDLNSLIVLINNMARHILEKNAQLTEAKESLEERVVERTGELQRSLQELENAQSRLVESERLSALGKLSAGIAHELNTPLAAISSSGGALVRYFDSRQTNDVILENPWSSGMGDLYSRLLQTALPRCGELVFSQGARARKGNLRVFLEQERVPHPGETADFLVEMEIDDEVEQFLPFLYDPRSGEVLRRAAALVGARRTAQVVAVAAEKGEKVVAALRTYLHPESEGKHLPVSLEAGIESVLTILYNRIKRGVRLHRNFAGLRVLGAADQLGQVWMNLILNAVQAIESGPGEGEIVITTERENGDVRVTIEDSGSGIPAEVKDRIFDPFFTTKEHGEGIGLGLEICRTIITKHQGTIWFSSEPGKTRFVVVLPAAPEQDIPPEGLTRQEDQNKPD
ncbi:Histidine kinase-, DNA gyrase B-, and HSP90-like ATPase [Alkalispirochaeta americana]|uniref:histidine kinase n=1 Tax=Alkalispirochaeta americana TaxID=159291 RepID=A0A1N6R201_9SPIO|nr:ATP-binding protein [Alkalispirochaeta americana]SIQ22950.1 Histidine kinase-, DNA gyrase B-, and HSP90-like ATPase [Alkalispirochaeta americana]